MCNTASNRAQSSKPAALIVVSDVKDLSRPRKNCTPLAAGIIRTLGKEVSIGAVRIRDSS